MSRREKCYKENTLTVEQKTWLGQQIAEKCQTAKHLSKKYDLPVSSLYRYAKLYKKNIVMHENCGRPPVLSPLEEKKLFDFVSSGNYKFHEPQVIETLQELAVKRAANLNKAQEQVKLVSRRTQRRIEKKLLGHDNHLDPQSASTSN